jgi:hypothetical protein
MVIPWSVLTAKDARLWQFHYINGLIGIAYLQLLAIFITVTEASICRRPAPTHPDGES